MWKKVAGKILSLELSYKNVLWQGTFKISKKRWSNLILPKQSHFYIDDTLTEKSPGWWLTKWIKSRLMIHKLNEVQPSLIMFTLPRCFKPHPLLLHRNPAHMWRESSAKFTHFEWTQPNVCNVTHKYWITQLLYQLLHIYKIYKIYTLKQ